jgi:hypothetical protein
MTVTIKDGQANVAAEFRRDMMAIQLPIKADWKSAATQQRQESNDENKKQKRNRIAGV